MEELDARLKERLLALADAAPRVPGELPIRESTDIRRHAPTRTALPVGAAVVAVVVLALVVMQLRPAPVPASSPSSPASYTPSETPSAEPSSTIAESTLTPHPCSGNGRDLRWFVGLGTGAQPAQIEAEKRFVANYNAANADCNLLMRETVPNANAYDVLKTEIAAGNAPDIVGPVGTKGLIGFDGLMVDMAPLVSAHHTNLGDFEPAVVDYFKHAGEGQIGLPYDIYPGYLFYNKDMFAKAGLAPLPTKVGDQYQGRAWTWDELAAIAQQLTVDSNGKNATQPGFDPQRIAQFGFDNGYADARRFASAFGGGSLVASDNHTAQIPPAWDHAWNWYYHAMWTSHAAADAAFTKSALTNGGGAGLGTYGSLAALGEAAMETSWAWEIPNYGTVGQDGTPNTRIKNWDIGVLPSYNGATSSPLDADTFVIPKGSKVPDQAYEAMLAIMADPNLMTAFGGEPARLSDQAAYYAGMDATMAPIFPGNHVTWSVIDEMAKHPAVPSQEGYLPNAAMSQSIIDAFFTRLQNNSGLNVEAEIAKLKKDLQAAYDGTYEPLPLTP